MTDKYTRSSQYTSDGVGIDAWMRSCVVGTPSLNVGPKIMCKMLDGSDTLHELNSVGILFKECKFLRQGTSLNHGSGGSNCSTGIPVCFVHVPTFFPKVFNSSTDGILSGFKGLACIIILKQIVLRKLHLIIELIRINHS